MRLGAAREGAPQKLLKFLSDMLPFPRNKDCGLSWSLSENFRKLSDTLRGQLSAPFFFCTMLRRVGVRIRTVPGVWDGASACCGF